MSDDVVSMNPNDETQRLESLISHVEQFQQRLAASYLKMNQMKFHHEQALTEWTLYKANGTAVTTAHTYGVFNEQGRLQKLIGFFEQELSGICTCGLNPGV